MNINNFGTEITDRGVWTQTFFGGRFYPQDPREEEINIDDIAHALAHIGRYNGHTSRFYSVLEHSILCAAYAKNYYEDETLPFLMLMHDATEAYIGDLIRPMKRINPDFQTIENNLWNVIVRRFGITENHKLQCEVDNQVLLFEKEILCPNSEDWPSLPDKIKGREDFKNFFNLIPDNSDDLKELFYEIYDTTKS